jgi:hypothetical protein
MMQSSPAKFPARTVISSSSLSLLLHLDARAAVATGVTGNSVATLLFAVAAVVLLTLVFRAAANQLVRAVSAKVGNIRVHQALKAQGPAVLHDLVLPGAYGGLGRIDHATLTAGGILCILRAPCKGLIFGSADQPQWSSVDGTVRHRFLNPLIQLEGGIRALREAVPGVPVAGIVVFAGRVEFSCAPPPNVIHVSQLRSFIADFAFEPGDVEDWDAVWLTIRSAATTDAAA